MAMIHQLSSRDFNTMDDRHGRHGYDDLDQSVHLAYQTQLTSISKCCAVPTCDASWLVGISDFEMRCLMLTGLA
jgi:hypothetical protein